MIGAVLAWDPTGSMIRLAQMIKIINRFKFINVKYGDTLEKFIRSTNAGFETSSFERDISYKLFNGKTRGKLNTSEVRVFYFSDSNIFKPVAYLFLWLLKYISRKCYMPRLRSKYRGQLLVKKSSEGL